MDGPATLQGPIEEIARKEAEEAEDLLNDLGISVTLLSLPSYILLLFQWNDHNISSSFSLLLFSHFCLLLLLLNLLFWLMDLFFVSTPSALLECIYMWLLSLIENSALWCQYVNSNALPFLSLISINFRVFLVKAHCSNISWCFSESLFGKEFIPRYILQPYVKS